MNKTDEIFAIAHIENTVFLNFEVIIHMMLCTKTKACWIQFAARSYYSGIDDTDFG